MTTELDMILERIDVFEAYLLSEVGLHHDFLGRSWLDEQIHFAKTRKNNQLSYLFRRLFWQGYVASSCSLLANFSDGVRTITQMLQSHYAGFASDKDLNDRFFLDVRQDNFEGLWTELILLQYLQRQKISSGPNLKKRRFDIWLEVDSARYQIEVKTLMGSNNFKALSAEFGSFLFGDESAARLRRILRKASKQLGTVVNPAIAIDVSLNHDAVIPILAGLATNFLQGATGLVSQIRNLKHRRELPVVLILRDPYTGLAAHCLAI